MLLTNTTASHTNSFSDMFNENRGWLMVTVIIFLAAIYPKIGFVKRSVVGSVENDRNAILKAMALSGFELKDEIDGIMIFRADNVAKKLFLMYEDTIKIYQQGTSITIEGIRKEVVKIEYRLRSFMM